jgi:hypothetical protein
MFEETGPDPELVEKFRFCIDNYGSTTLTPVCGQLGFSDSITLPSPR